MATVVGPEDLHGERYVTTNEAVKTESWQYNDI
jgi:hypothetical protein